MRIRQTVLSVLLCGAAAIGLAAETAQAGPGGAPIDCSILLCMDSGFPDDGEGICAAAKAEVIRRVTPNPHSEPPLQIWNCPLGASHQLPQGPRSIPRLYKAASEVKPTTNEAAAKLWLADIPGVDDVGVYNFIRSIRVYNVRSYIHEERGEGDHCRQTYSMHLGQYASNGKYYWTDLTPLGVPGWVGMPRTCRPASYYRGVAFEWTDYEGNHGTETMRY